MCHSRRSHGEFAEVVYGSRHLHKKRSQGVPSTFSRMQRERSNCNPAVEYSRLSAPFRALGERLARRRVATRALRRSMVKGGSTELQRTAVWAERIALEVHEAPPACETTWSSMCACIYATDLLTTPVRRTTTRQRCRARGTDTRAYCHQSSTQSCRRTWSSSTTEAQ
jgi:hypothetical protein